MTAFVFFISFLLHIITFVAIVQLLKHIKQLKQHNSKDLLELFETYLQEIKEENRLLEKNLTKSSTQAKVETIKKSSQPPIDINKKYSINSEEEISYSSPEIEVDDSYETSLQSRILQLYHQGLSQEEIAKKLNCGKTETALIIKLHAKNE